MKRVLCNVLVFVGLVVALGGLLAVLWSGWPR
jgi:hypothetical protein